MGNAVAAAAITHLFHSFNSVDYILMVGIAGGIPDTRQSEVHIRLGDVVVSDEHGVLQYDNIKQLPDRIEIRNSPTKPGATLINAAKALAAEGLLGRYPWEKAIKDN